ncbi:MAG: FAD-dependent oxidoreductase [Anaerolineales bacterium]|nr:FAD-dependent oxidoreductase [Anaerolineales bacterium]
MSETYDVIVVGGGPAGASAALTAASAGLRVLLIERGEYVGAKNTSGAMLLAQVLQDLVPDFWKEAPLQRPVERHRIMMASGERFFQIEFGNRKFLEPPFNGFSVLRQEFDEWLVSKARAAGALVVTGTVVDDLLYDADRIVGVKTRRQDGDVRAKVVILADGVNSLLAQKAGLKGELGPHDVALGVKELIALPEKTINERFGLDGNAGAAYAVIGDFARGIPGGGFIYTNKESVSIGVVVQPKAVAGQKITPDEVLERFKARPEIARLIEGGRLIEYSGHLVPEGGLAAMPRLFSSGLLVAGDAAGFCVNTGILLMGMNLAIASGKCAGETAIHACQQGDFSASTLSYYETILEQGIALSAIKTHRLAPKFMQSPRLFDQYPDMINNVMERMVTVGAQPHDSALKIARAELGKIKLADLLRDGWTGVRAL